MPDFRFAEAFVLWGSATTWLEIVAVLIALAMVGCNIREVHWGWPLAIISSLMYFALFWRNLRADIARREAAWQREHSLS